MSIEVEYPHKFANQANSGVPRITLSRAEAATLYGLLRSVEGRLSHSRFFVNLQNALADIGRVTHDSNYA